MLQKLQLQQKLIEGCYNNAIAGYLGIGKT